MISNEQIKQIHRNRDELSIKFEESPWLKDAIKEITLILKKHQCSFGMAKEALEATILYLDNTMVCRSITPYKKSTADLETTVDKK